MRADSDGYAWFTFAGGVVGGVLGGISKVISNALSGQKLSDGVLGAIAGGAVYGAIATSPILYKAAGAHANAIASYASAFAESVVGETVSYFNGEKELSARNIGNSVTKVIKDTVVEGTQTYVAGAIAGKTVKTNRGWFRPQKFKSSFTGKYAMKVWGQSSVQTALVTVANIVRGWFKR